MPSTWKSAARALAGVLALVLAGQAHFSAPRSRATSKSAATYTVRRGDNLAKVSKKTRVPLAVLISANRLAKPDRLLPGQVLALRPAAPAPPPPPPPASAVVITGDRLHRVETGQNLDIIARRYRMSVSALAKINGIRNRNRLRAGQLLRIPGPPWLCPVRGRIDFADSWAAPRPGGRRHLGTDLFAFRGTPIVASVSGLLEHRSGALSGVAFYLRGDDGNTYYGAHLDALLARPGRVDRGAVIGTVGNTGNARGHTPHLHFEIKPGGAGSVNPFPTISRWC